MELCAARSAERYFSRQSCGAPRNKVLRVGLTLIPVTCLEVNVANRYRRIRPPTTRQILAEVALEAIRGRLMGTRLSLVRAAFTRLRGSGDAPADAAPAVNVAIQFDPTGHPDVISGRRTPEVRQTLASCTVTEAPLFSRRQIPKFAVCAVAGL